MLAGPWHRLPPGRVVGDGAAADQGLEESPDRPRARVGLRLVRGLTVRREVDTHLLVRRRDADPEDHVDDLDDDERRDDREGDRGTDGDELGDELLAVA